MKIGSFEITPFVEQTFKLDGGTMFGVVPKKIWCKLIESDENNLVRMETNLFVLSAYRKIILLDTGFGDFITEKEKKIYSTQHDTNIEAGLAEQDLSPDDIDIVFLTHLHSDHAGGAVKEENGKPVPRFRNAVYLVQKEEWDDAMNPNERTAAVYFPERLEVLEDSGQLQLLDGDSEFLPGIRAVKTGGHTRGHQAIEAESEDSLFVFYADIVPSQYHLRIPYVASVDLFPLEVMEVKRKLFERLSGRDNVIAFDHDLEIKMGRVIKEKDKFKVTPAE